MEKSNAFRVFRASKSKSDIDGVERSWMTSILFNNPSCNVASSGKTHDGCVKSCNC
jgi:hypothetical protein